MTVPHHTFEVWKKSSYSANTDNCVEVQRGDGRIDVGDTKCRADGHLSVSAAAWSAFLKAATK